MLVPRRRNRLPRVTVSSLKETERNRQKRLFLSQVVITPSPCDFASTQNHFRQQQILGKHWKLARAYLKAAHKLTFEPIKTQRGELSKVRTLFEIVGDKLFGLLYHNLGIYRLWIPVSQENKQGRSENLINKCLIELERKQTIPPLYDTLWSDEVWRDERTVQIIKDRIPRLIPKLTKQSSSSSSRYSDYCHLCGVIKHKTELHDTSLLPEPVLAFVKQDCFVSALYETVINQNLLRLKFKRLGASVKFRQQSKRGSILTTQLKAQTHQKSLETFLSHLRGNCYPHRLEEHRKEYETTKNYRQSNCFPVLRKWLKISGRHLVWRAYQPLRTSLSLKDQAIYCIVVASYDHFLNNLSENWQSKYNFLDFQYLALDGEVLKLFTKINIPPHVHDTIVRSLLEPFHSIFIQNWKRKGIEAIDDSLSDRELHEYRAQELNLDGNYLEEFQKIVNEIYLETHTFCRRQDLYW